MSESTRAAKRVTVLGGIIDLLLGAAKLAIGIIAHSAALVADAIHSLSDLFSDIIVWLGVRAGEQGPDEDHPYGHRRYETLATLVVGILITTTALGIIADALWRLQEREITNPSMTALVVAIISVVVKEGLFRITRKQARDHNMHILDANAQHHRSDALSSVVVVVGLIGVASGISILDLIAALVVGMMLLRIGLKIFGNSIHEMTEAGVDGDKKTMIEKVIMAEKGVEAVHLLRTRRISDDTIAEVHVQVNPRISVTVGHQIAERDRTSMVENIPHFVEATVHIDPEDDEEESVILTCYFTLMAQIKDEISGIEDAHLDEEPMLHMLTTGIEVHLVLSSETKFEIAESICNVVQEKVLAIENISQCFVRLALH